MKWPSSRSPPNRSTAPRSCGSWTSSGARWWTSARSTTPSRSPATRARLAAIISLLKPLGIKEIAKTGIIALFREPE
ncbi:MAG: hypothetical protein U5J82_06220 [Desulfobacterales bacterium]|nr:hypothetical protein [Desulfobacterales bacterium]